MFRHDDEHACTYAPGETVFEVDDPAHCMYVVLSGALEIRLDDKVLERIAPGGIIGEMALIEGLPRSATVVAVEESRLS
ncbi:MAG: cyclic nucleotide-binding domain-containing protein, partial [Vulcanimicrobiaceae bacterium]